ncbi:hypothetical protein ACI780_20945 [Geodermatophilus sp. SYSU D00814]
MHDRELAAWHEAGHAVAAVMRGDSRLITVGLGDRHGEGTTWRRGAAWDGPFVAYAGPWAEARRTWGDRDLEDEDDDGLTFDDYLLGVLLEQRDDAAVLDAASLEARATGLAPERNRQTEMVWRMELERVWPTIAAVSKALLAGATVTHEHVDRLLDASWEGVDQLP